MKTEFSLEVRVNLCEGCGAPVSCERGGTSGNCKYCGAPWYSGAPVETLARLSFGTEAMPEEHRMARLYAGVGVERIPSAATQRFLDSTSSVQPEKVGEATLYWWSLRRQLDQTRHPSLADELHLLTMLLANHFGATRERLRHRAMLESALESLRGFPSFEQQVLADLARNALNCGDPEAAEGWLARCDRRPDDLAADSAYRHAAAQLAIVQGNAQGALQMLGGGAGALPVSSQYDVVTAVNRAHAFEMLGNLAAAEAELRRIAASSAGVVTKVIQNTTTYVPLPRTLASIRASIPERSVSGWILLVLGLIFFGLGMGAVVAEIVELAGGFGGLGYVLGPIFLLMAFIFCPLSWWFMAQDRPRRRAMARGSRMPATVQSMEMTGTEVAGRPLYRVLVLLEPPGAPPSAAAMTILLEREESVVFHAGAQILVLAIPSDPQAVALVYGA